MGAVYKAYDKELNRVVALKLVHPELTADASSMERFKQELLLASNILRIHDLGDVEGVKFISMAYVEGEDLQHALEREKRLPLARALNITRQLCAALDAAHAEGVVHRDLKPQNILIDQADNAYVSDFGLAKSLERSAAIMTRTGEVLGTPRYMSPEQVEGKPADHRSDIYSLGLIAYEMVTGDLPFQGDSALQVMYQRITDKPKSPKEVRTSPITWCGSCCAAWSVVPICVTSRRAMPCATWKAKWRPRRRAVCTSGCPCRPAAAAMEAGKIAKLSVILNLENVAAGRRLWSGEVSGGSQDLLTLEDQAYSKLAAALALRPGALESSREAHPTDNIEAYDLYLKGRNALRRQRNATDVQKAIDLFDSALKKDQNFALAYAGVADASLQMYDWNKDAFWPQKALEAAQQAQQLNDEIAEVHFSLGGIYNVTGRIAESIIELNRALQLAPNSDEGYRRLGAAYLANGRKEEAMKAFQKAVELNPYYWKNYNALGNARFEVGDNDEALSAFRKVTELEPDNGLGYMNIGVVNFRQGKYNDSIPFFEKALKLQPRADLYSNLGTAYFFLKRYKEAVPIFEKAVEMSPDEEWFVGNLADAYRWSGRADQAQSTYEKAIGIAYKELQVNPFEANTMGHLALYYAKKGDSTQALQFIRRARSIDPNSNELIYNEAVVQALANHPKDALNALRQAFHKGYSPEEARNDPELKSLEGRPEFGELLKEFSGRRK